MTLVNNLVRSKEEEEGKPQNRVAEDEIYYTSAFRLFPPVTGMIFYWKNHGLVRLGDGIKANTGPKAQDFVSSLHPPKRCEDSSHRHSVSPGEKKTLIQQGYQEEGKERNAKPAKRGATSWPLRKGWE